MKSIDVIPLRNFCFGIIFFGTILFLFPGRAYAQCQTFKLTDRGDTINCKAKNGLKQGPWLEVFPELRGNPGYEEEGTYLDGKKEGIWRRYSLQGDVLAIESYNWGLKNGKSQYFSLFGMEREESWWAIDPQQPYDTIEVPDLYVDGDYRTVIVANEGRSMKHGTWTFYDAQTGRIQKSEEFIRDSAVGILGALGITTRKSVPAEKEDTETKKVDKPAVVQEWEKKNSGKKKVKVRDGSTGY
jgi:antitoxin component YwqK of YwqJK toxin-antitoxin module